MISIWGGWEDLPISSDNHRRSSAPCLGLSRSYRGYTNNWLCRVFGPELARSATRIRNNSGCTFLQQRHTFEPKQPHRPFSAQIIEIFVKSDSSSVKNAFFYTIAMADELARLREALAQAESRASEQQRLREEAGNRAFDEQRRREEEQRRRKEAEEAARAS